VKELLGGQAGHQLKHIVHIKRLLPDVVNACAFQLFPDGIGVPAGDYNDRNL